MALAAFHPDRFGFAGSMSGFLYLTNTTTNGARSRRACSNSAVWTPTEWFTSGARKRTKTRCA